MAAPKEILQLVERFDRNRTAYTSGEYNETQLRREFLDPFFTALGWDVENKQGFAEAYKDVVHEDAIKIGTATKAPDYSFRIGGIRKFFVEAKKPFVSLKEDISPAFQLRRYAWSAKLPLSILADFEEFAVYDCRIKPHRADKSSNARIMYLCYTEYNEHWEEIGKIFSKEALLKGSFDKYSESKKAKRGTAEVDDAFLGEIEQWRKAIASNIALRNPKLTQRELNFSVQRTIDRMIFLRICEDRGIESYGALMSLLNGERVYRRLTELFRRADVKYNSGLFHFEREKNRPEPPDELTLELSIDDKPLKEIIKNLYYPESPYEFSVLPADILGQVYEQFLGKVIRLTAGHRAVVEDKPEVKKAGGVYYTPTYIVDYIVKNTVGRLLGVQGLGDGGWMNNNATMQQPTGGGTYGTHVVQGTECMEGSGGVSGGGLPGDTAISQGGTVRPDELNAAGGSFDPSPPQADGGVRTNSPEGISPSSFDSPPRRTDGAGNPRGDYRTPDASASDPSGDPRLQNAGGGQNAHPSHPISQVTPYPNPQTPYPNPHPLFPKPHTPTPKPRTPSPIP